MNYRSVVKEVEAEYGAVAALFVATISLVLTILKWYVVIHFVVKYW